MINGWKKTNKNTFIITVFVVLFLSLFIRLINLSAPLAEQHGMRQTHTAITVQDWVNHGFDLLNYRTPVLGHPWTLPFEFPIFQATAYIFYQHLNHLGFSMDAIMRITSILYFYLSLIPFFLITKYVFKDIKYQSVALLLYLFSPFSLLWSRSSMIEFCTLFFTLSYVYLFLRLLHTKSPNFLYFILALVMGSLGYLSKVTTMLPAVIFLAVMSLFHYQSDILHLKTYLNTKFLSLLIVAIIPVVVGICWMKYTDAIKIASGFTFLTSKSLANWNFGGWKVRVNPLSYLRIFKNLEEILPIGVLSVAIFFYHRKKLETISNNTANLQHYVVACAIAVVITPLVFFNLYSVHNYYWCAVFPFLIVLSSVFYSDFFHYLFISWKQRKSILIFIAIMACLLQVLLTPFGRMYTLYKLDVWKNLDFWKNRLSEMDNVHTGQWINNNTTSADKILLFDDGWSAVIPYYANRRACAIINNQNFSFSSADYQILVTGNSEKELLKRVHSFPAFNTRLIHEENGRNVFVIESLSDEIPFTNEIVNIKTFLTDDGIIIGEFRSINKVVSVFRLLRNGEYIPTWFNAKNGIQKFAYKSDDVAVGYVIVLENANGDRFKCMIK